MFGEGGTQPEKNKNDHIFLPLVYSLLDSSHVYGVEKIVRQFLIWKDSFFVLII